MDFNLAAAINFAINESKRFDLRQDISVEAQAELESYLAFYHKDVLPFDQKTRRYPFDRLPSTTVVNYMRDLSLWPGSGEKEWERVTNFAGLASKREINTTFKKIGDSVALQGGANRVFLSIPWQDVPGRLHTFEFVTGLDDRVYRTLPNGLEEEAGLAFLPNLNASEDTVFAIGNSLTAAQMLFQYSYISNERLPLVAWRESTNTTWNYVKAKKVIFWEQVRSWRVFEQAKKVKNAVIADVPDIASYTYLIRRISDINGLLKYLEDRALPWPVVFKNTIIKLSHVQACDWISRIRFNNDDWSQIIACCNNKEKALILPYFNEIGTNRCLVIGNNKIIEQHSAWYLDGGRNKSLITDVPFRISNVLYHEPSNKTVFIGTAYFKDHTVPFQIEERLFRKDTEEILRGLVVKNGFGYPIFNTPFKMSLVDISIGLHSPNVVVDNGRVGWNETQEKFILPEYTISHDGVFPGKTTVSMSEMLPCPNLRHKFLISSDIEELLIQDEFVYSYWALILCTIFNSLHKAIGLQTYAIGVLGDRLSAANKLLDTIQSHLGLLDIKITKKSNSLKEVYNLQQLHDIPIKIRFEEDIIDCLGEWIYSIEPKNTMCLVSSRLANLLSLRDNWIFINCPKTSEQKIPNVQGLFTNLMQYILSQLKFTENFNKSIVDFVNYAKEWLFQFSYNDPDWKARVCSLISGIENVLKLGSPIGASTKEQRILNLVFRCIDDQIIKVNTRGKVTSSALTYDPTDEIYRLIPSQLFKALKVSMNLPPPESFSEWLDILEEAGVVAKDVSYDEGIPIRKEIWKQMLENWRQKRVLTEDFDMSGMIA